ncbi:MAG: sulfite exporter TauE/SafE family protein [Marmoricola sp.]
MPPVVANVTNTLGLVPGSLSGAIGYRRELRGQRSRIMTLGSAALLGGTLGAFLLLWLPACSLQGGGPSPDPVGLCPGHGWAPDHQMVDRAC